jgi:hypothetical protein
MDMNEYALETLARDRLAELRAIGERTTRARAGALASRPLRAALGRALIRLGHRLRHHHEARKLSLAVRRTSLWQAR